MWFSHAKRKEDLQKHPFQSSRISANQAGLYHQNLSDEKYNKTKTAWYFFCPQRTIIAINVHH